MTNLVDYLKLLTELETSVYKQEKANKIAHKELVYKKPEKPKSKIRKPENKAKDIEIPVMPEKSEIFGGLLRLLVAIGFVVGGFALMFNEMYVLGFLFAFIGVIVGIFAFAHFSQYKDEKEYYKENYISTIEEKEKLQRRYENEMNLYNKRLEKERIENDEKYERTIKIYKKRFEIAEKDVNKLDKTLADTKATLKSLYDKNIIFPKYRNLVAISTIYEYFASGRVTELEGPTGAYNLYENELRQNIVINNLETISSNLENIKNNQYILYSELENTNELLGNISNGIKGILDNTSDIAVNSYITAYASQITAQNTAAMATLQLMD